MLASGIEIRTAEALDEALDALEAAVGPERLGSLHLNDSQTPLGSNRDRHANIGEGEIGLRRLPRLPQRAALRRAAVRARDARAPIAAARRPRSSRCASGCAPRASGRARG